MRREKALLTRHGILQWRMGAAGRTGRDLDQAARALLSSTSNGPGLSRTNPLENKRPASSTCLGHAPPTRAAPVAPVAACRVREPEAASASAAKSAYEEMPCRVAQDAMQPARDSYHLPPIGASVRGHGERNREPDEPPYRDLEPASPGRPKTAALRPKSLRFAEDCVSGLTRPHSAAVNSPTKCPRGAQRHL